MTRILPPSAEACLAKTSMPNKKKLLIRILIPVIYLAVWQVASLSVGKALLLPGPADTLARFAVLLTRAESYRTAGLTLLRIVAGYVAGVLAGVLLACASVRFAFVDQLLSPLRGIVKATPVTSFILLALLWITTGMVPVFISFLMVVPIVWMNVQTAIRQTDPNLIEMAKSFRFGTKKTLTKVYVPSVMPQFLASCTTSFGFAWKSCIAAEIIAQPKNSIGYALYQSKLTLETTDMFAWTLLVILLSMLLEKGIVVLSGRVRRD